MTTPYESSIYVAIARNLRDFGYRDISANMIAEVHAAMRAVKPLPHGVIGMFAKSQLEEAFEESN